METISVIGSDLKFNVHVEPVAGMHMSEYDFDCAFFVRPGRKVVMEKRSLVKVDEDNYLAPLDGNELRGLGRGMLHMELTAYIPDSDFADETRKEKAIVCTGVTII